MRISDWSSDVCSSDLLTKADHWLRSARCPDNLAVVRQRDAVGRVDVERLGLVQALAAGSRVAAVTDADAAFQQRHRAVVKHVPNQSVAFVHTQHGAVCGGVARRARKGGAWATGVSYEGVSRGGRQLKKNIN